MKDILKNKLILRKEVFGGILFDRNNLTYEFHNYRSVKKLDKSSYKLTKTNKKYVDDGIISAPIRVYWEITKKCNLRCPQCFNNSIVSLPEELNLEQCFKVISGLKNDGVMEVRITGGEPTQKRGWNDLVAYALKNDLVVTLNTNGIYKNMSTVKAMGRLGINQVIVSIDGPKEIHEKSRGEGNFEKVLKTIKILRSYNTPIRINTLLTKQVLPHIEEFINFFHDIVQEICFMQLKPIGRGGKILSQAPSFEDVANLNNIIKLQRKKYPGLKITNGCDFIPRTEIVLSPTIDLTTCASGFRGCNIDSIGNIYACGFLEELGSNFSLGNIIKNNYSLLKIWHCSEKLKKFRDKNLKKTKACKKCAHFRKICFGSCVVMEQYKLKKSLNNKDPYCYKENE